MTANKRYPKASPMKAMGALFVTGALVFAIPAMAQSLESTGSATGELGGTATGSLTGTGTVDPSTPVADGTGSASGGVDGSATGALDGTVNGAIDGDLELESEARSDVEQEAIVALDENIQAEVLAEAEANGLLGAIAVEGDAHSGAFVAMNIASDAAIITDYRAQGDVGEAKFFSEIRVDDGAIIQDRLAAGAEVHLWTPNAHVEVRDDSEATLLVRADAPMQVTFATDASVDALSDRAWIRAAGQSGHLAIAGDGTLSTSADGQITADLMAGAVLRFVAATEGDDEAFRAQQQAFADGRLGAEAEVLAQGEAAVLAKSEYSVDVEAEKQGNELIVRVADDDPQPRVVSIDLDQSLWAGAAASELAMTFDGEDAIRGQSAADVYAATGTEPQYAIVESEGHMEAVAYVPGFSVHELGFAPQSASTPNAPADQDRDTPAAPFALAGLALLGLAALKRRH